jgi:hypothetical protein
LSVLHLFAPRSSTIDLATVRETLLMMRQDLAQAPCHAGVCAALDEAVSRIDALEAPAKQASSGDLARAFGSRFVPWTPER